MSSGPLAGITVLDFTRFQQGPMATRLLADMGAEVIKVEAPSGDPSRQMLIHEDGHCPNFETLNSSKRSIVIDLKHPQARDLVLRLASTVDVVVENYRPGMMERFGIGYDDLAQVNAGLIYASASTFGPHGPRAGEPGYDHVGQAVGGLIMRNRRDGEDPELPVGALADAVGALMLMQAILAGLVGRTLPDGRGQRIETSLYGSAVALQMRNMATETYEKVSPLIPAQFTSGTFTTMAACADDQWLVFGALEAKAWPDLCRALDLEELLTDPRFHSPEDRARNQDELLRIVHEQVRQRPAQEWTEQLVLAGVSCSVAQDYAMIIEDPQARANQYVTTYDHPRFGELTGAGFPVTFFGTPPPPQRPAPLRAGEDTADVLLERGWTHEEVAELSGSQVVRVVASDEHAGR